MSNPTSGNNDTSGASIGNFSSDVQDFTRAGKQIFKFDSDKIFATYEIGELVALPKSLFYDAATSDGAGYSGLFAYYILGKGANGKNVPYHKSETKSSLEKITTPESKNPTAYQIISETSKKKDGIPAYLNPNSQYRGQLYNVKDFIFCKYYGIIPNNRMITLRRFPHPTLDSLRTIPNGNVGDFGFDKNSKGEDKIVFRARGIQDIGKLLDEDGSNNTSLPVSQAVTFFGGDTGNSLSTILGINTGLNFSQQGQSSMVEEKTGDPGLMNSPYGDLIKSIITGSELDVDVEGVDNLVGTLLSPQKNKNALQRMLLDQAVSEEGPLSKKIFVNVNTVNQMMVRAQGFNGGFDSFTLDFHYNLTSVGEMNTKLLFLDLMTNLLSLGADYGQFLSPEIRLYQSSVGLGFPGGPAGYAKSIVDPIQYIRDTVSNMLSADNVNRQLKNESEFSAKLKRIKDELNTFANSSNNTLPVESELYKSISVMMSEAFLRKVYYSPIMLSGYPTGDWHMVVGNPLNPIAMIGNLVCTNVKITFNDELGPDDFPTEIKATYTLQPGRQRHRGDFESMFNRGNGRLYLGQLVNSGESTQAFINTQGVFVNQIKSVDETITKGTSNRTGEEKPQ
jgi:hypothetical protein